MARKAFCNHAMMLTPDEIKSENKTPCVIDRYTKYMQKNNKPFKIKLNGAEIQWENH